MAGKGGGIRAGGQAAGKRGVKRSWAVLVVRSSVLRPQRAENWGLVEVEKYLVGHRSLAAVGRVLMVESEPWLRRRAEAV